MGTEVLDGKYSLDELLGRGGMGEVYAGRNLTTGKRVAIKRLRDMPDSKHELEARFVREAQAASALEHANVVQVFDVAQSDGIFYMVMELLRGESLSAYIEREAPMPAERAAAVLLPALAALHHAHQRNIIHRDLKPDNIFLSQLEGTEGFTPKLLDFGIAKLLDDSDRLALTRTGAVMGSPLYMSPEQTLDSGSVDARADIYAMGVILYEMLSGQRPFEASSYPALVYAIMHGPARPLLELVPTIDPAVVAVVDRAMARNRDDRPASTDVFANELRRAVGLPELSRLSSAIALAPAMQAQSALGMADTLDSRAIVGRADDAPPRSTRGIWGAGAIALVLALGALALFTGREADAPEPVVRNIVVVEADAVTASAQRVAEEPIDAAVNAEMPQRASAPPPERTPAVPARGARSKVPRREPEPVPAPVEGLPFQQR